MKTGYQRHLYIHVHSSIVHNSQKVKVTKLSINRWKDTHKMWYIHTMEHYSALSGKFCHMLYIIQVNFETSTNWDKPVTKPNTIWFHFYKTHRVVKIIGKKTVVAKSWGRGETGSYCLMGIEFSFTRQKVIQDGWWWWLHNAINFFYNFL